MSDLNMLYVSPGMLAKTDRLRALHNWITTPRVDFTDSSTRSEVREFLNEIKPVLDALHDLICCDRDMWHMNAMHFTCTEAEAIADLLRALGGDEDADVFMDSHAEYDQPGDIHYREGSEDD